MPVVPRLVRRTPGLLDLAIKNRPGVIGYRLSAASTLNSAYADPTNFLTVASGSLFASPTVTKNGMYQGVGPDRGLTRLSLDINDYASAEIPGDGTMLFLRVSEQTSGGFLSPGPILAIPPPDFFVASRRILVLTGTAPELESRGDNLPPTTAMHICFPKFADDVRIYNEGIADADALYFSFGIGLNEMRVLGATHRILSVSGANEILIRGEGGSVDFSLSAALVNGLM